jgi:hypothetical protein
MPDPIGVPITEELHRLAEQLMPEDEPATVFNPC